MTIKQECRSHAGNFERDLFNLKNIDFKPELFAGQRVIEINLDRLFEHPIDDSGYPPGQGW